MRSTTRYVASAIVGLLGAPLALAACSSSSADDESESASTVTVDEGSSDVASTSAATTTAATESPTESTEVEQNPHFAGFGPCDDARLAGGWLCATVDVPVDRSDPTAGTIALHVMGRPHTGTTAGAPFFTTPGGPGSEGLGNYALWQLPGLIEERHDVITMDPRGTGRSGAIDCPAVQAATATYDEYVAATTECGEQLGDASDRYGAANRAMDVEAVREFMGYDTIIYHGASYGTVDVQAYAARYPARLEAIVLDSGFVVDDVDFYLGLGLPAGLLDVVERTCAADAECSAATDDPRGAVESMIEGLVDPLPIDDDVVADQASIAVLIRDYQQSTELVEAAVAYAAGDAQPVMDLVAEFGATEIPDGGDPARDSAGANVAGWCNDQVFTYDPSDAPDVRAAKDDAAVEALADDDTAPWTKQSWVEFWGIGQCVGWPAPDHLDPVVPEGSVLPDVPTLIFAADRDFFAAAVGPLLERFPNAAFYLVADSDHIALSRGACAAEFEAEFIETLAPPPGEPCADESG